MIVISILADIIFFVPMLQAGRHHSRYRRSAGGPVEVSESRWKKGAVYPKHMNLKQQLEYTPEKLLFAPRKTMLIKKKLGFEDPRIEFSANTGSSMKSWWNRLSG